MRLVSFCLLTLGLVANAAAVTIDFEGVVTDNALTNFSDLPGGVYEQDGFQVSHGGGENAIVGRNGSFFSPKKDFGSAFVEWCPEGFCGAHSRITVAENFGATFSLLALDVTLETHGLPTDLVVIGYYAAGGTVTQSNTANFDDWSHIEFDGGWHGLAYVEFTTATSYDVLALDNIVVSTVPVPAAVWLFASALAGLSWLRRKPSV